MGRQKTPAHLLRLRGSWRSKGRSDGPRPLTRAIRPPVWLCPEAKRNFRRLCRDLKALGVYSASDIGVITMYADAEAHYGQLTEALGQYDLGSKEHARLLRLLHTTTNLLTKLAGKFGLEPTARGSLSVPPPEEPNDKGKFFDPPPDRA